MVRLILAAVAAFTTMGHADPDCRRINYSKDEVLRIYLNLEKEFNSQRKKPKCGPSSKRDFTKVITCQMSGVNLEDRVYATMFDTFAKGNLSCGSLMHVDGKAEGLQCLNCYDPAGLEFPAPSNTGDGSNGIVDATSERP